jgi:hypothetical protein
VCRRVRRRAQRVGRAKYERGAHPSRTSSYSLSQWPFRLSRTQRQAAGRPGCRAEVTGLVHVPAISSRAPTWREALPPGVHALLTRRGIPVSASTALVGERVGSAAIEAGWQAVGAYGLLAPVADRRGGRAEVAEDEVQVHNGRVEAADVRLDPPTAFRGVLSTRGLIVAPSHGRSRGRRRRVLARWREHLRSSTRGGPPHGQHRADRALRLRQMRAERPGR